MVLWFVQNPLNIDNYAFWYTVYMHFGLCFGPLKYFQLFLNILTQGKGMVGFGGGGCCRL